MSDAADTHTGGGGGMFPSTRWSLIEQVDGSRATHSREALGELVDLYRPALMKYLRFVCRLSEDRAEDTLQGFLTEKVVRDELIRHADQRRGRFRTFLKTVLNNYVRSEARRNNAQKRKADRAVPVSMLGEGGAGEGAEQATPDVFEVEWARTLLQEGLDRFQSECAESDCMYLWDILNARLVGPALADHEPESYRDLVDRMGFTSPSQVWNALNKATTRVVWHIKSLIAAYAKDEQEMEEEIHDLFRILSRTEQK